MQNWFDGVMSYMQSRATQLSILLLFALVIAIVAVLYSRAKERRLAQRIRVLEQSVSEQLGKSQDIMNESVRQQEAAVTRSMHDFNDSVIRMMGEVSRTQQGQLDSFGGQLRAMSRSDEERMNRMQQTVENRLNTYDAHMESITQVLDNKLSLNEQRLERMRQSLEGGLSKLQSENEAKLEQMRLTVDEKLHTTLDRRLGESFQLVTERLEQVSKGLGEMQTLASGVGDLKKVLTNVKTRGTWGEVQLGSLLEQILAPGQYVENACVKPGSAERVDYAVVLPGQKTEEDNPVYLPIDAKFPQEDYLRLVDASEQGDPVLTDAMQKALIASIRLQAKRIHDKYINPPYTTDYALMFLPVEGLYAEVLRSGSLAEQLQGQYRVVITGPTTVAALLNSLQMGFRTLAIEKRSSEVWALLGAVKTEFGRFADLLVRTQRKLRQASDSIEDAARKTRTIQRRLRDVEELSESEASRVLPLPVGKSEENIMTDESEDDWE